MIVPVTRHSQSQKKVQHFWWCVVKNTDFQLMKIINRDDTNDNYGSGSNDDNDVKDYGDSYGNHHKIHDDKDDNDNDNSGNSDQKNYKLLYIQTWKIF